MNIKMTCVFGLAISAMLSLHAADVDHVLVRQLWPWSTDIQVEYELNGVTAPVDLQVKAYKGETEIALPANALKGKLYAIDEAGAGTFFIDPVAVFGTSRTAIADFRVSVEAVASQASMTDPLYMILDLVTGDKTYLSKADFFNGAAGEKADILAGDVGKYETDFGKVGPSFNTTLKEVLVWTGVTNNLAFKHDKMVFRRIPAGGVRWLEGSDPDQAYRYRAKAETQRYCTLSKSYWMAIFETTREQMRNLTGASSLPKGEDFGVTDIEMLKVQPIQYYGWTGLKDTYTPNWATKYSLAISLPTEAQWEFACRAGTTTGLNSGKELSSASSHCPRLDEVAWYASHMAPRPEGAVEGMHSEVGLLKPNAYGLYDMHGNVAEFTLDRRDITAERDNTEVFNPLVQDDTKNVVICGGQTKAGAALCASAARDEHDATKGSRSAGFRLIITID